MNRLISAALLIGCLVVGQAQAASLSEGFESGIPADWVGINNSSPVGDSMAGDFTAEWHAGDGAGEAWGQTMPAHMGTQFAIAHGASCVTSTATRGTIDNWLVTPVMTFNAGDTVSFYARCLAPCNDSLEARISLAGSSLNIGTPNGPSPAPSISGNPAFPAYFAAVSGNVGDFTTVLGKIAPTTDINNFPTFPGNANNFPTTWTQFSYTVPQAGTGRLAFRYLVFDGGYDGVNSWVIGVDDVSVAAAALTYLPGDANKDGYVKFADYLILEQNFGKTGKTWAEGDFTGDGNVKFADYLQLEQNFGKKAAWATPEPATMSLLVIGGIALLRRKNGYAA